MTQADTDDLPVLERGILREDPRAVRRYWVVRGLIWAAIIAVIAVCVLSTAGCAIPVRPIAKVETGTDGKQHFIPDPEQEPQVADSLPWLAAIAKLGGPWGDLLGVGITLLGTGLTAHHIGRRRERKARHGSVSVSMSKPTPGFTPDDGMAKP